MFDHSVSYIAAYTNQEPSHDPEIAVALAWLEKYRRVLDERILVCLRYSKTHAIRP